MQPLCITVIGAGIIGLWQALTLARRGHRVRLLERSSQPFAQAASSFAGAMLAPYCEAEATPPVVHELGLRSLALWRRFAAGLHFAAEAHVVPRDAMAFLLRAVQTAGADVGLGVAWADDRRATQQGAKREDPSHQLEDRPNCATPRPRVPR